MGKLIRLKCQNCGQSMDMDSDKHMFYCPYCGEKLLYDENDAVKLSELELRKQLEEYKEKERDRQRELEDDKAFIKMFIPMSAVVIIGFVVLFILHALGF